MDVAIVDYGLCNIGSIYRSLEECGGNVSVASRPSMASDVSKLVLPGVGAFGDGISNLKKEGWVDFLREAVLEREVHLLGVCLGMQLLASTGSEGGSNAGLDLIPGRVEPLFADMAEERLPHVGWNEVSFRQNHPLVNNLPEKTDFYFVHSFHFIADNADSVVGTTPYCNGFSSVIAHGTVYGTQFHPEKSFPLGFRLLHNFLTL